MPLENTTKQPEIPKQTYIMYYRHNHAPFAFKGFAHAGDLRSAINRANKHCAIMGYRLNFVAPMFEDLDAVEAKQVNRNGGEVKMMDYGKTLEA